MTDLLTPLVEPSFDPIHMVFPNEPNGKAYLIAMKPYPARIVTSPRTREYQEHIRLWTRHYMGNRPPIDRRIIIEVFAHFGVTKSWTKWEKQEAIDDRRPQVGPYDMDNVIKAVMDGMNGIAFVDDKLIGGFVALKQYSDRPRVEVTIREWTPRPLIHDAGWAEKMLAHLRTGEGGE